MTTSALWRRGRLAASELQVGVDMGLLNVGKVGFDTAWDFALGLPKHDLGWPSLGPLFRDNNIPIRIDASV